MNTAGLRSVITNCSCTYKSVCSELQLTSVLSPYSTFCGWNKHGCVEMYMKLYSDYISPYGLIRTEHVWICISDMFETSSFLAVIYWRPQQESPNCSGRSLWKQYIQYWVVTGLHRARRRFCSELVFLIEHDELLPDTDLYMWLLLW